MSKEAKYMGMAEAVAKMSKDTSTQVGAVLIGPGGEGGPWGYNGAPRKCAADEPGDARGERPEKYFWFSHAESNAIANAARAGFKTLGCTLVVTHFPCMDCAKLIVQSGVVRVIAPRPVGEFATRWVDHTARAIHLFNECGVDLIWLPEKE